MPLLTFCGFGIPICFLQAFEYDESIRTKSEWARCAIFLLRWKGNNQRALQSETYPTKHFSGQTRSNFQEFMFLFPLQIVMFQSKGGK